jgi:O-antigen biosynthesis protein
LVLRRIWSGKRAFRLGERKSTLFVFDQPGPWKRYRCDHRAEQLALSGYSSDIIQSSAVDLAATVDDYDTFVLYRVPWDEDVGAFIERAHAADKPVIFDTDDLVFEPDSIDHLSFIDRWPESARRAQAAKFASLRRTLEECGRAIVSTEPLAEHARHHVDRVDVVPNAVSEEMVRRAERVRDRGHDGTTLAYFSGTATHERDFLEAADAVLWALENYPEVRFLVVGKLTLDERFDGRGPRVVRMPLQPWDELPKLLASVDVNLAPLERDNPIAKCKSCVKYLEAGLVRVPTIASSISDFRRVIDHGRNGFLVAEPHEWREALCALIESPQLRDDIGATAAEDVRANHTTKVSARQLAEVFAFRTTSVPAS